MTKAPVGPPIWTLLPPKKEIINPPIIAVYSPFSGPTPEAMAKAIDRAKYWEERGFKFDPKTMTDYEMDNMVRAYEKAHNIVITQK